MARRGRSRFSMDAVFKLIIRNADVLARIVVGMTKEFEGMGPEEAIIGGMPRSAGFVHVRSPKLSRGR